MTWRVNLHAQQRRALPMGSNALKNTVWFVGVMSRSSGFSRPLSHRKAAATNNKTELLSLVTGTCQPRGGVQNATKIKCHHLIMLPANYSNSVQNFPPRKNSSIFAEEQASKGADALMGLKPVQT